MNEPTRRDHLWGRRDFLTAAAWTAILGSLLAGFGAFFRLLFRRAPVDPPTVFRAGQPADYGGGEVSERMLKAWRVFIVNDGKSLFAVHARCTHLGCTPRWLLREGKFKCPCHGSGFTTQGRNFEGPAPRPLERARIWVDREGELWVDVAARFRETDWKAAGAFVPVDGAARGES